MPATPSEWELIDDENDWEPVSAPRQAAQAEIPVQFPTDMYRSPELMRAAAGGRGPYEAGTELQEAVGADLGRLSSAIGTGLHTTGEFGADLAKAAAFQAIGETELAGEQMLHKPWAGAEPETDEGFVAPWTQGKEMLPLPARALSSGVEGLIQTAPQMGIAALNPIAGALSFGFTPEGFQPLPAALGLAAPFAGKLGGMAAEKIAQRLGVESEAVLRAAGMAGGSATAAATMTSPEIAHVLQMPEGPEQDKAIADLAGNMGVMGILGLHGTRSNERPTNARNIPKAAEVHGNVREQPVQGTGEMPPEVGREGVRRNAQAEANAPRETPLKEPELEEMFQLQQMKKAGRLSMDDAQRLDNLEGLHKSGMSADERAYIDEIKPELQNDVEVKTDIASDEPFSGMIATVDRARGKILINPQEFSLWLKEMPEGQRKGAVRSLMAEEGIHLATPDAEAKSYWDSITAAEKAIARRRYTGKWSGKTLTGVDVSETHFGHEALRSRIQQLAGMDPTEIASAAGREKWTLKGLTAMENSIAGIRRSLGTKASKEQSAILDRVQSNLNIAKTAVAGGAPGAVRRDEQSEVADRFIKAFKTGSEVIRNTSDNPEALTTKDTGLGLKSVADLDALLEAQKEFTASIAEDKARMKAGKMTPAELGQFASKMRNNQFIREVIEMATDTGSWSSSNPRNDYGERPLDYKKNPEVADWLRQHGEEVGVQISEPAPGSIRRHGPLAESENNSKLAMQLAGRISEAKTPEEARQLYKDASERIKRYESQLYSVLSRSRDKGALTLDEKGQLQLDHAKLFQIESADRQDWLMNTFYNLKNAREQAEQNIKEFKGASDAETFGSLSDQQINDDIVNLVNRQREGGLTEDEVGQLRNLRMERDRRFDAYQDNSAPGAVRRFRMDRSGNMKEHDESAIAGALSGRSMGAETRRQGLYSTDPTYGLTARLPMRYLQSRTEKRGHHIAQAEKGSVRVDVDDSQIKATGDITEIQKKALLKRARDDDKTLIWESPNIAKSQTLYQASEPGAIRRGGLSKKGQEIVDQKRRIAEMFAKARGEELPPELATPKPETAFAPVAAEERVGATEAGALPSLSGKDLEAKAKEFLAGPIDIPKEQRPSFEEFSTWAKRNMEGVKPEQLRDMWENQVWNSLLKAEPQRLESWRKALGLEGNYGARAIVPEAPPEGFKLEGQGDKILARQNKLSAESKQRYRNKIIGAIARKLIGESIEGRAQLNRESVGIDDIAFSNEKTKHGPYTEITRDDLAEPDRLNAILRDQARASSADPESASRRLVAVADKQGHVFLLSTYNDAGTQRVTDPTGGSPRAKPTRELNKTFLNQYRPFASVLLTDPIKGLRQRFESVSEFNDKMGKEASDRARIGDWEVVPEGPAAEDFVAEGSEGIQGEGGSFMGPGKQGMSTSAKGGTLESETPLTGSEIRGLLEFIQDEAGDLRSPESVAAAMGSLSEMGRSKSLTPQARVALNAFRKVFSVLEKQNPEADMEKLVDTMSKEIYQRYEESETTAQFIRDMHGGFSESSAPASIRRQVRKLKVGRSLSNLILKTGSAYDEWMVDRIERNGGALAEQIAPVFRHIIDREKQLYGELTPSLDKARALAGGTSQAPVVGQIPNLEALRAAKWLHGLKKVKGAPFAAIANTVGAIENTMMVPTFATKLVDAAKLANLEAGVMLQPVIRGFKATGKFARNITATAYDTIREGRGDLWDKWTAGIAKANGKKISEVRQFMRDFKEVLDTPGVSSGLIEKVNQDFTRVFPKAVTHIKHAGQWQAMLHADLFNYLENTARRASHIRAFREQIPDNAQGQKVLRSINEDLRAEMGTEGQNALDALMRTMQGIPTDNYASWGMLGPTESAGSMFRFANNTVGNVMARLALTGQMFVQPGELATGATPMFFGYKNYLKGMARLKELYPQLEQQGMVNRVMYDFTFDPNSAIRSSFRMAGNTISKAFGEQMLNELQEGLAACTAKVIAEKITAKTLSPWENRMLPETFKAMGFNHDEVAGLMQGDQELLGQFQRKAAAFLTSGNKAMSEGSKLGANRLFNSIFRFQSYPMMKLNQLRKVSSRFAEAWGEGTTAEKRSATEQMARFIGGTTAQGILTAGITALAYSGAKALAIKSKEALDEPVDFMTDMFMSTISGPLYVAWRGMRNKGLMGISENMTRTIFPFAVARELSDLATGSGRYHDLDAFGKIGKFLQSKTPGTRAITSGMALLGLSKDDKALDAALDGFYRWRRDAMGFTERESFLKDDKRHAFRTAMNRAVEALKDGEQDNFVEAYSDAAAELVEAGSSEKVGESLRRATVLRNATGGKLTLEEMDALRSRIGDEAVDRLEWFDLMLERAADGDLLPRYDE